MSNTKLFSVAIYKKQIPKKFKPIDVVSALHDQFKEELIDMVQPINGMYRVDLLSKEPYDVLVKKGLSLQGLTIPAMKWIEGMDCPQQRIEIGQMPRNIYDHNEFYIEALMELNLQPCSIEPHFWKNKTGFASRTKSGKKVVYVKKPDFPIPDFIKIKGVEAKIWYWGKPSDTKEDEASEPSNDNNIQVDNQIPSSTPQIPVVPDPSVSGGVHSDQTPTASNLTSDLTPSQDDEDIIDPTPLVAFKPPEIPKGRSRSRSTSSNRKRSRSPKDRMESPRPSKSSTPINVPKQSPLPAAWVGKPPKAVGRGKST